MGIRAKLMLFLLSALIPVIVAGTFTVYMIDRTFSSRIEAELANTGRLEAARISDTLENYREDVESLASGSHVRSFVGDLDAWRNGKLTPGSYIGGVDKFNLIDPAAGWPLQQLVLAMQRKAGIIGSEAVELRLVDRAGRILGETLGFEWEPDNPLLLNQTMAGDQTRFGEAFQNADNLARLAMISPIVSEESKQVVGALMVEARLGPIVDLVEQHEGLSETSEAHIAQPTPNGDAEFITLLRFARDAAFNKVVPREAGLPINLSLESPGGRVVRAKDYRGVESVLAIETLSETGWGLVVKMDQSEAYGPVRDFLGVILLAALATVSLVVAGYCVCLHPLATRLKRTASAAHQIMDGNLQTRIQDDTPDEIGYMADIIDRLAHDLHEDQERRALAEDRLRHQASHDALTTLHNRQHANEVIRQLSQERNCVATIMFLDLDGFKGVNDLYGHAAGDAVLVAVAGRLNALVGEKTTLARWGGDEFVMILPGANKQQATTHALMLQALFDDPVATEFGTHQIGCSIGMATSAVGQSLTEVIIEADTLMYEQKKRRQSMPSISTQTTRTVENALHDDRVEVWFQPIVHVEADGRRDLTAAEALVRIRSRDGGIILPGDFLDSMNCSRLARDLDHRVLTLALESLSRWRTAGVVDDNFRLSINLTGESLRDESLIARLGKILARLNLPPERVVIEISENAERVDASMISRLRNLGVLIALDDVGLHHSNLDRLVSISPDIAKIDRQWLNDPIVLPRLIDICFELGMEVVAEGVETTRQQERLLSLNVEYQQGFLFDRPCPAVEFLAGWTETKLLKLQDERSEQHTLRLVV